ncbi:MAG TPA: selenocysteine-specific translation elongation factor [Methanothermococcus okinawensis]|uniref:Selenocysteine-specific elongation factor n=1 Tax=Methanothermococcus okinawensis TaxID=155863 RepID=A0A832ZDF3_9EURY|nr:selenocysteine-specific translation elongation factor [Methanothermococcus okinawensis]HIP91071.1 selenocysteine-specific translation elongation factor [Methanothermococcus okinawensis]
MVKSVNVGIFGHIDHGKTTLAKALTEVPSTSSLDKLPESRRRGITIDLGFSFFKLGDYLITLVDAPGHADLIRAVVGAAEIIDLALLVVDAREGPKTQTGEHLLILDYFNIPTLIVINKIDVASQEDIKRTEEFIRAILNSTENLKGSRIIKISAKKGIGIEELKNTIREMLDTMEIVRNTQDFFKMPIDHAFPIKGIGTVVTGTVLKGKVKVGDELKVLPLDSNIKVKSIQRCKENVDEASAGDRIGMAIQGLDARELFRGCVLTSLNTKLKVVDSVVARIKISPLFKYPLKPGMRVHVNIGMLVLPARVTPFKRIEVDGDMENIVLREVKGGEECYCVFQLEEKAVAEIGEDILITRLDLPPTTLRICGKGEIVDFKRVEELNIKRVVSKVGMIKIDRNRVLVLGLANSKEKAERLIGQEIVIPEKNIRGRIKGTFGTKGYLVAEFDGEVENRDQVLLRRLIRWR